MERIESVYRRDNERPETAPSGGMADAVPGFPERRCVSVPSLHRRTLRTATPNSQHCNYRTRSPRTGDHNSYRGRWAWRFKVPGSEHGSTPKLMSAFADIVVSANDEFAGQHLLTLSRKDIQKRESSFFGNSDTPVLSAQIQNRAAKRLTAGRSESQHKNQFNAPRPTLHTRSGIVDDWKFLYTTERFCTKGQLTHAKRRLEYGSDDPHS